jgi:hypothetical protein
VEYVRFKRSSGSSRVGKCLFVDKKLYDDMIIWSMMGLVFEDADEIDLAAIEAYIALTTSSIIDTIQIKPENILLIDDFESSFEDLVMVTEIKQEEFVDENGEVKQRDILYTVPKSITITNNIWDGQSLLDSSMFGNAPDNDIKWVNGKYVDKGMLLLRNRFFKSACFNTNIQDFFKDNNITNVNQLNGKTLAKDIRDIKLITTPSSIKYLKFGSWESFISQCSDMWGIVKYDKPTHYFNGRMVQTHYQLLNTLQLSKEDIGKLLKPSIDYVELLKNDERVFRLQLNLQIQERIYFGDFNNTEDLILTLLSLNEDFYKTDLCTDFKRDLIDSYIKNMKRGHILINGNYSVLFGNGLEMLKYSCNLFDQRSSLLNIDEVYCKNFKPEIKLIGSRSPHITMSNIWLPINTVEEKAKLLDKYFNSSKQIIHINSMGTNVLERLSSADFDSDQLLLSDNQILISNAVKNYDKFLVSTSAVKSKKIYRRNTAKEKSDLDIKTSKNLIGDIVNVSAFLNSLLWHKINTGLSIKDEFIQELYKTISQLNIMSCIEIDKAKKEYSIDNEYELDKIKSQWQISKKPSFFSYLEKERVDRENEKNWKLDKKKPKELRREKKKVKVEKFEKYECSLDYLTDELSKIKRMSYRNTIPSLWELLANGDWKFNDANRKQIDSIIEKVEQYKKETNAIWKNPYKDSKERYTEVSEKKEQLINDIGKLDIKEITLRKILKDLNTEYKNKKIKQEIKDIQIKIVNTKDEQKVFKLQKEMLKKQGIVFGEKERLIPINRVLLLVLFKVCKKSFVEMFKQTRTTLSSLEYTDDYNQSSEIVKIYNMNYKQII